MGTLGECEADDFKNDCGKNEKFAMEGIHISTCGNIDIFCLAKLIPLDEKCFALTMCVIGLH